MCPKELEQWMLHFINICYRKELGGYKAFPGILMWEDEDREEDSTGNKSNF